MEIVTGGSEGGTATADDEIVEELLEVEGTKEGVTGPVVDSICESSSPRP